MSDSPKGLTRTQLASVLLVSLAVFAFAVGPIWRRPWDIDASVYWSYLAIPPLCAGLALATRRFAWARFVVDCLIVGAAKFAITYAVAIALWAAAGDPPKPPPAPAPPVVDAPPPPPVREPDPSQVGGIAGTIRDSRGPRAGVLVWLELDPRGFRWPTPPAVELSVGPRGLAPTPAAVATWQELRVKAADARLHTLVGSGSDGATLFNVAVPAGGVGATRLTQALGAVQLHCGVHADEPGGVLNVLDHPFSTHTDGSGHYAFVAPIGDATVRAANQSLPVSVAPGEKKIDIDLENYP